MLLINKKMHVFNGIVLFQQPSMIPPPGTLIAVPQKLPHPTSTTTESLPYQESVQLTSYTAESSPQLSTSRRGTLFKTGRPTKLPLSPNTIRLKPISGKEGVIEIEMSTADKKHKPPREQVMAKCSGGIPVKTESMTEKQERRIVKQDSGNKGKQPRKKAMAKRTGGQPKLTKCSETEKSVHPKVESTQMMQATAKNQQPSEGSTEKSIRLKRKPGHFEGEKSTLGPPSVTSEIDDPKSPDVTTAPNVSFINKTAPKSLPHKKRDSIRAVPVITSREETAVQQSLPSDIRTEQQTRTEREISSAKSASLAASPPPKKRKFARATTETLEQAHSTSLISERQESKHCESVRTSQQKQQHPVADVEQPTKSEQAGSQVRSYKRAAETHKYKTRSVTRRKAAAQTHADESKILDLTLEAPDKKETEAKPDFSPDNIPMSRTLIAENVKLTKRNTAAATSKQVKMVVERKRSRPVATPALEAIKPKTDISPPVETSAAPSHTVTTRAMTSRVKERESKPTTKKDDHAEKAHQSTSVSSLQKQCTSTATSRKKRQKLTPETTRRVAKPTRKAKEMTFNKMLR